jgi:hypothetical protein
VHPSVPVHTVPDLITYAKANPGRLTMLLFVNPQRARAKPLEMARSMQALTQKRIAESNLLLKAPELFKPG